MNEKIYVVRTEGDEEGKSTQVLGYATGALEGIKKYFDDRKYYSLSLTEEELVSVTPEAIREREEQLERQEQLRAELSGLEKKLRRK